MKKKAAVIGSGIAGLTLGNFLKKNSLIDFTIYEKQDGLSFEEGYGIQLSVNCISILRELDFDLIKQEDFYNPKKINFLSFNNKKICDLNLANFNTDKNKYTTLRRSVLIEFLQEKLFKKDIKFNKEIIKISELKDKILINFKDNTNDLVDYLFVCDGVFSNTKKIIESNKSDPKFSNAFAIRSIIKSSDVQELDSENISVFMGSNAHIVTYPVNKRRDQNLVCIIRSKKKDIISNQDFLEENIFNQSKKLKNLFKNNLKAWPIYISEKSSKSSLKKVFYIGDAFHTLMPTMAQGAAQSIEGAYEIYNLVSKNIKNINEIYYNERIKRLKSINIKSKINFISFHMSNVFSVKIRNLLLKKLVKNEKFLKSYLGKVYN
ncbi:MAG: salicylate 1-monooxygenase [Candidatus Pelagibacter sp.]|nr:salicylate 1-monooxygenase [Candidatus Pelagibacter sp.]OUW24535.1 MAG: hypothetical protein CBD34_00390 [Rickettsiales bacterium TMED174]